MLNKQLRVEKEYRNLPPQKKLLRYLKEIGKYRFFVKLVMKKHKIGFQDSINLIKINPDIFYLIGHFTSNLGYGTWFCGYDETTNEFIEGFSKFKPIC